MPLEEIREARTGKLKKLQESGEEVFPIKTERDFSLGEAMKSFSKLARRKKPFVLAGRIFALRAHGAITFCDFKDGSLEEKSKKPASFQAYLSKDVLGEENFSRFSDMADIGDFLEFKGRLFLTKRKEKTIEVSEWRILAKSLRPLPEKWHGLSDVEERFRKRYLDILMNEDVRFRFSLRSRIISEVRDFLNLRGFLEMETPMLQPIAGGATAHPFKTHHNALDVDLFLRIAPELYLKRLLIAGFEKVYELGRNFRNEGIDVTHNPEFTMLEFYQTYKDSVAMRQLVEEMVKSLVKKVYSSKSIEYEGKQISFAKNFSVISFSDVLRRHALISDPENAGRDDFKLKAKQLGVEVAESESKEKISDNIFKKICRAKLIQPTFVVDYPLEISPLAKKKKDKPHLADRFQLIIGGLELANGFSELNDPVDQKERFLTQEELRKAGDKEAAEPDESFIEAMEYGMPPAGGVGIGIDRLVMFLLNIHNIKEVILFPTMRPKE